MKYNKRRVRSYGPELDENYVLNNLELAVKLLDKYNLGVDAEGNHYEDILGLTDEEYKKPDFSGEDREYLNKYGPSLSEIEGEDKEEDRISPDDWLDDYGWREEANRNDDS